MARKKKVEIAGQIIESTQDITPADETIFDKYKAVVNEFKAKSGRDLSINGIANNEQLLEYLNAHKFKCGSVTLSNNYYLKDKVLVWGD